MATTDLTSQLSAFHNKFKQSAPQPAFDAISEARENHVSTFRYDLAIQEGEVLPAFRLPNGLREEVDSADLLKEGPLLITFYRGGWCPYCNLALHDLQKHLDRFAAKGITLVAISPELPDSSLTTAEKHDLKFPVLSDVGNKYATKLSIVWKQPDSLRPIFQGFGNSLEIRNGDDSFELPVPTTLLVDRRGVVRNRYIEADWAKRLDTKAALEWVDALEEERP